MHFVLFTHSLVSDWNHGNAHFQRGILRELIARGHSCQAWEPADGWSRACLLTDQGPGPQAAFQQAFPELSVDFYGDSPDLDLLLEGADVVMVHEWTNPDLVAAIGQAPGGRALHLLFHDTHRGVSAAEEIGAMALEGYDAVLAFGEVLAELYRRSGWGRWVLRGMRRRTLRLSPPRPRKSARKISSDRQLGRVSEQRSCRNFWSPASVEAERHRPRRALPGRGLRALESSGLRYRG